jgi:hypothetical protein
MIIKDLKASLANNPDVPVQFILPDGVAVPAHAHVTEVARIDKRFVDCGGTLRTDALCRMQTLVADDADHRLTSTKLLRILNKAASLLGTDELEVDVEHEAVWISQFPLASIQVENGALIFQLGVRHTACLAEDKCGITPRESIIAFKPLPSFAPRG